jgi:hypothetical protein
LRAAAELAVDTLSADLQKSRRQHGTFPIAQHEVNALLDQCFLQRVVLRLLLDQHAALAADSNRDESDLNLRGVACAPIVDWVPVIPLIQDTVEEVKSFSIEKNGALFAVLCHFVLACCAQRSGFIISAFENTMPTGACPEIQVKFADQDAAINANSITCLGAPSHLHFMVRTHRPVALTKCSFIRMFKNIRL